MPPGCGSRRGSCPPPGRATAAPPESASRPRAGALRSSPRRCADDRYQLARLELVGDRGPEERHHHGGVDEPRGAPLQDPQLLVGAVELVDEGHSPHAEQRPLGLGQLAQRRIESPRAEKEPRVQHLTVRESATEALEREPCTARGIGETGRDPLAAAGAYAPAAKLGVLAEPRVAFELRELRAAEHRTCARGGQGAESALIEPLAGASRAQQPLD